MYIEFQVKTFILYKINKPKEVIVVNINYEKIEKCFDVYNEPIHKIRGLENSHKLTLKEMIEKGWSVEFTDNIEYEDPADCDIIYMMYVFKKGD